MSYRRLVGLISAGGLMLMSCGGDESSSLNPGTTQPAAIESEITDPSSQEDLLLEVNFDSDAGPFVTGESEDFYVDRVDGTYRISAKAASGTSPNAVSYAVLAQNANAVRAEVTIVEPGGVIFGILCLTESAESWRDGGFGFFISATDASLMDLWQGPDSVDEPAYSIDFRAGQRIGISCLSESGAPDARVEGLVDGEVVTTRPNDHSGGFGQVALFFLPRYEGETIRFDDVTVRAA